MFSAVGLDIRNHGSEKSQKISKSAFMKMGTGHVRNLSRLQQMQSKRDPLIIPRPLCATIAEIMSPGLRSGCWAMGGTEAGGRVLTGENRPLNF